jgi:hypothetical protein
VADKIRFHLDEHIPNAIAKGLRQRGIDVTTTVEAGLRTLSDDSQAITNVANSGGRIKALTSWFVSKTIRSIRQLSV